MVGFSDDSLGRLIGAFTDDEVFDAAQKDVLTEGIRVSDRHYEFLAWSNSQLRDAGCWPYASDAKGNTTETIRRWMGEFSEIKNIPKYMARMGQCFTQSQKSVKVPLDQGFVTTVEDVTGKCDPFGNRYCFSDGIGRISYSLVEKVCRQLVIKTNPRPSAYQIRYAGYKGMLALDPTLKGDQIIFRNSQLKFQSSSTDLEVAKWSKPGTYISQRLFYPVSSILQKICFHFQKFANHNCIN